jgi:uncharacterized protein (DUF2249 family)
MRTRGKSLERTGETSVTDGALRLDLSHKWYVSARNCALQAYEPLPPIGTIELVSDRPLTLLFTEFQRIYRHGFYWWPLENGPDIWRVMLAKPAVWAKDSCGSFLNADQRRLSTLWRDLLKNVELCCFDRIRRRAAEFSLGLRRRIRLEEGILFLAFEERARFAPDVSPTTLMRLEHRQIEKVLGRIDKLTEAHDCASALQAFDMEVEPDPLFINHDHKEEMILGPVMDRTFSAEESRMLLSKMQSFEV